MTSPHVVHSTNGTTNIEDIDPKILARVRDLCRQHFPTLTGASSDECELSLLSGGFSNYMYLCSLPRVPKGNSQSSPAPALAAGTGSGSGSGTGTGTGSVPGAGASPERVIVRFFGEILLSSVHSLVLNSVIFAILSERGIGPRLYGVFPGGRIEQYLESRPLRTEELSKPEVIRAVAHCLRLIHSLDMPLSKQPTFAFDAMRRWLEEVRVDVLPNLPNSMPAKDAELLRAFDYEAAIVWLEKAFATHISPVVFCHNDLQENNILCLEPSAAASLAATASAQANGTGTGNGTNGHLHPESDSGSESESDVKLLPIDFEYCSYNYRGMDWGNCFNEWAFCYENKQKPGYFFDFRNYPTRKQMVLFWRAYFGKDASDALRSEAALDSDCSVCGGGGSSERLCAVCQLELEAALGSMLSNALWSLWSLMQCRLSRISFGYAEHAADRLRAYAAIRERAHELLARWRP